MYFCYIDESGDHGRFDIDNPEATGSPYFILAGLIVHSNKWKLSLDLLKSFRKKIARETPIQYHIEFHCAEMIDPHKVQAFKQLSIAERWELIEDYAEVIGQNGAFSIIAVVIDKHKSALNPDQYATEAVTKLYQAYEEFLKKEKENGLLFFDRANEKNITTHVRKLLGTGATGQEIPNVRIGRIIEDPIFRISSDSMFIQSADVIAYTLKEKEFPQGSRKKYHANEIFRKKLQAISFKFGLTDEAGIIRL